MVLNEVYITGRKYEKKDDIIEALNIDIGDPVFLFLILKLYEKE